MTNGVNADLGLGVGPQPLLDPGRRDGKPLEPDPEGGFDFAQGSEGRAAFEVPWFATSEGRPG